MKYTEKFLVVKMKIFIVKILIFFLFLLKTYIVILLVHVRTASAVRQFFYITVGFKGVYISWTCFPDGSHPAYIHINIQKFTNKEQYLYKWQTKCKMRINIMDLLTNIHSSSFATYTQA